MSDTLKYSVFMPKSSRSIFVDYPELRKIKAFSSLNNDEMLFVWYYACESSPFFKIASDRDRVRKALENSFLKSGRSRISVSDEEQFLAGKFSAKITTAIEEMHRFKVGPRVRAMMMIEKGMTNLESILMIDASNAAHFMNKDGEVDFSKKKAYVDTLAKAQDIMPNMIKQLEGRYNVSEDKKGDDSDFDGESVIDNYHDNE